jgi:hypothetical protein
MPTKINPRRRRFIVDPSGPNVGIVLLSSVAHKSKGKVDHLQARLIHQNATGVHVLKPATVAQGLAHWDIPADFLQRVKTESGLWIALDAGGKKKPAVKFLLDFYVLSSSAAATAIFADLFVDQSAKTAPDFAALLADVNDGADEARFRPEKKPPIAVAFSDIVPITLSH